MYDIYHVVILLYHIICHLAKLNLKTPLVITEYQ